MNDLADLNDVATEILGDALEVDRLTSEIFPRLIPTRDLKADKDTDDDDQEIDADGGPFLITHMFDYAS